MKELIHNSKTYGIKNGQLYSKTGNMWAYIVHVSDPKLIKKAIKNGWKEAGGQDLIDDGFHSYKRKND